MIGFEGFEHSKSSLYCESVKVADLCREYGSPLYIYSRGAIENRIRRLQSALNDVNASIHFAVKACSNIHILNLVRELGVGADIVSAGELFRATVAQVPSQNIIFSGVGKSQREIEEAIAAEIAFFNVENTGELDRINAIATKMKRRVRVSFRVNPNVDPKTHKYISTGLRRNKFGLAQDELTAAYKLLRTLKNVDPVGLSCHIGSQIASIKPFEQAWTQLIRMAERAPFQVRELDLGGGLAIPYSDRKSDQCPSLEQYGRLIAKHFKGSPYKICIEPGRSLIGPTAVLATQVVDVKRRKDRTFFILDSGMNDLIRPALYQAKHPFVRVEGKVQKTIKGDLVGPVCESADVFEFEAQVPRDLAPGEYLAFGNAGAYGMSMASNYNSRLRPAEVLVQADQYYLIRSRENYADLIKNELL